MVFTTTMAQLLLEFHFKHEFADADAYALIRYSCLYVLFVNTLSPLL